MVKKCFEIEMIPEQWLEGIQHPLYKQGEKRDPLNYRGIMLLNVISKVYEAIIQKGVDEWAEEKEIIKEEQGGFRRKRGCQDQIFILNSVLNRRKKEKTYCAFIDLRKAYDSVWREGLWKRL